MLLLQGILLLIALLWLLFLTPHTAAQSNDSAVARLIVFHSPTCPHCREVLQNVLPPLQAHYGKQLEIRLFDLTIPANYEVYAVLHQKLPTLPDGIPQGYIDGYFIVGTDQFRDDLPALIDDCLAKGGCDWAFDLLPATSSEGAVTPAKTEPVYLAYCYDPACLECDKVTYDLNYLQAQYPHLVIKRFNLRDDAAMIEAMCQQYGVPEDKRLVAPAIFVGQSYLLQTDINVTRLKTLIENSSGAPAPWEKVDTAALTSASGAIAERFSGFSALAVAAAGLLDGINPCAFTTIIFFVSYLALVGHKGRDVLLVGASFTLAVFLTYLAMGMGLSALVGQVGAAAGIGRIIYAATALICLIFAALSLWDFIKIRQGKLTEIALQLPKALKKRIHDTIRTRSRVRRYVLAAFGAGVLVSVFELACTGQVYLPTIVFMTGVAQMRLTALGYLVIYNVLFVVPLIGVFAITYWGTSSQRLTMFFQTNAAAVKLFTALLFSVLGVWLGYLVLAA
jgi:hypothetical protein